MNRTANILRDRLAPRTLGEMIDALIIMNLRMWHAQELFFDLDKLEALPCEEIIPLLTYTTRLNLLRNQAMDGIDARLAEQVQRRFPLPSHHSPKTPLTVIWEPT
ncbi:MAG: hypothetical protein RML15_08635 [Bacteroidota bacterium]|nr:hypothetical protein [Candidatus Kapabacteria bacterium]MDW8272456.1 hypothetical protein [Bacteroidota bacterium]